MWQVAGPEVSRRPSDVRRSLYEQVIQVYRWLPSDLRPEQTVMLSGELNDIVAAINDALDGNLQLDGEAVSVDPPVWDDAEGVSYGDATSTYVMMSCSIGVEVEKLNAGFGAGRVGGISLSDNTPEDVGAADAGVGTEASRDDHVHGGGAAAATATPEATAAAGAVGTDTGYARGDHVHADRGEPPAAATATPEETAANGRSGHGHRTTPVSDHSAR